MKLLILALVVFVQNMAFTWSSRSRASGDPDYHRWASIASNGIWFVCQIFILQNVWSSITTGDWVQVAIAGIVYTYATSEGSVLMMKLLLKHEKGTRRVGAYKEK